MATLERPPLPRVPRVTPSLKQILGCAGLPAPVLEEPRRDTTRDWDRRVGIYVHNAVARLAALPERPSPELLGDVVIGVAAELVGDPRMGNLAAARGRVSGMTSLYMQRVAPPVGTRFLGAELPALASGIEGRADLGWDHPVAGVFYDEIKTWRQVLAVLDEDTIHQVHRYLDAGLATYGDRFAGVRVIPLAALARALLIDRNGTIIPLADTPLAPPALATSLTRAEDGRVAPDRDEGAA